MLINWFTVGAQVVNFLILVWLMRRYLYRPIIAAIDARAKQVAAVLAEADTKSASAATQLSDYQAKTKAFDDKRSERLAALDAEISIEHDHKMQSIKEAGDSAREAESADLRKHQAAFASQLSDLIGAEVFSTSRKVIADLANGDLEHQIIVVFIERLTALDQSSRVAMSEALQRATEAATLRSSFQIGDSDRKALCSAIDALATKSVEVRFEVSPTAICGLELSCAGQRIAWGVGSYLDSLSQKTAQLLDENFPLQAQTAAAPPAQAAPGASHVKPQQAASPGSLPAHTETPEVVPT